MGTRKASEDQPLLDAEPPTITEALTSRQETEALEVPQGAEPSMAMLLKTAIQSGLDPEGMEKLVALHERMEAKKAERAFFDALQAFQQECPAIRKTQDVPTKSGGRGYSFAPFDQVVRSIKPYLAKHGLSFKHDTPEIPKEGYLVVQVTISHVGGHHEISSFPVEIGTGTQLMSKAQVVSAAISFGRRNALIQGLGLVTTGEDDDGKTIGELVSEDQIANMETLLEEVKADRPRFLKYMNVESLDQMRKDDYPKAIRALNQKRAAS